MTVVFRVADNGNQDEAVQGLMKVLDSATLSDGTKMFTVSTIVGLILYFMVSLQCLPTVAVARAESGSRQFALIQLVVFVVGAYVLAIVAVQGLRLLGVS
jgi:ferrous iron transport protein B